MIGVGNCFSALYQGLDYYKDVDPDNGHIPGVMKMRIGGYHPADVQIVAVYTRRGGISISPFRTTETNLQWNNYRSYFD